MKFFQKRVIPLILNFLCVLFTASCFATDVVIETDFQSGRGLLRNVGNSCFIYTAKHVVDNADGIYINSPLVRNVEASLLTTYPQDLAVLQLPKNQSSICRDSSWSDEGNRVKTILNTTKKALLSFRKKNGALTEYGLRISSKELHSFFYVQLTDESKQFRQGMSGSIVYVGSYPIGMLVSVSDGLGKVLRMDSIADVSRTVLQSYLSEKELLASHSNDLTAFGSQKSNPKAIGSLKSSNQLALKGSIKVGESIDYKVQVTGNTAYRLISKKQSQSIYVKVYLLSPGGEVVKSNSFWTGERIGNLGFGMVDEGEYTLRVVGDSGEVGTYNFEWEVVATPEQLTGAANVLGHGDVAKGYLSRNTFADYKILATGNTAYRLISKKQSQSIYVKVYLLSPSGEVVKSNSFWTGERIGNLGFGMVDEGEYTLRVVGDSGEVGTYNFEWEVVATPEQLTGAANVLGHGDVAKGYLSRNTFADYKILATGNTAYRLISKKQSQSIYVKVYLLSPGGEVVKSNSFWTGERIGNLGFGMVDEGEYTLRVVGDSGEVGTYNFEWEVVATPEQLTGAANVLGHGDVAKGYLSRNTFADYKILATGNTAYRLISKKQSQSIYVKVYLLSPSGEVVKSNSFWTGERIGNLGFGMVDEGEYTLRVVGDSGEVGTFNLQLSN